MPDVSIVLLGCKSRRLSRLLMSVYFLLFNVIQDLGDDGLPQERDP